MDATKIVIVIPVVNNIEAIEGKMIAGWMFSKQLEKQRVETVVITEKMVENVARERALLRATETVCDIAARQERVNSFPMNYICTLESNATHWNKKRTNVDDYFEKSLGEKHLSPPSRA
jgi:hypothetical protein